MGVIQKLQVLADLCRLGKRSRGVEEKTPTRTGNAKTGILFEEIEFWRVKEAANRHFVLTVKEKCSGEIGTFGKVNVDP